MIITKKYQHIINKIHRIIYYACIKYLAIIINNEDVISYYKNGQFLRQIGLGFIDKNDLQDHNNIEYKADKKQLSMMIDHVKKIWTDYGSTDPYWSVITSEKFRIGKIEISKDEFYSSGEHTCQ